MPSPRTLRLCDVCGKLDSHPRHVQGVPPGFPDTVPTDSFLEALPNGAPAKAVAELMDPSTIVRHMDCCAADGCLICTEVLAAVGGVTGAALVEALEHGNADHLSTDTETGI
jgi:hypothetical protein